MKKRLLSIMLTAALAITSAMPVLADEIVVPADDEAIVVEEDSIEIVESDDVAEEIAIETVDAVAADEVVATDVIDGIEVTVKVAAGVLPAGANVAIVKVADEDINESTEDGTAVKAITFDVDVTDAEGAAVDVDKSAIEVSVKNVAEDGTYAVVADADVASEDGVVLEAEDGKPSYTITVIQPNKEDKKAPVFKKAKFLKDTYHRGERFEFETVVTDDLSGFNNANFYFKNTSTGESAYLYVDAYSNYYYDEEGYWRALPADTYRSSTSISNSASNGTYKLVDAIFEDNAGNIKCFSDEYYGSKYNGVAYKKLPSGLKNLKFKVVNGDGDFSPTLTSITLSPKTLKVRRGDQKEYKVTAKASSKQGDIAMISVRLSHKHKWKGNTKATEYLDWVYLYPKTEGSNEFVSRYPTYVYGYDYEIGTWKIDSVKFFSEDGIEKDASSSKYKNKTMKVSVYGTVKPAPKGALVKDIKFDNGATVELPKVDESGSKYLSVPFTVNLSGVKKNEMISVSVNLIDKKTGKRINGYANNYTWEWDSTTYTSSPKLNAKKDVAVGNFSISGYSWQGNYIVDSVYVSSYDYNAVLKNSSTMKQTRRTEYYRDYQDTHQDTRTSQMKKIKMTIKKK